MARVDQIGKSLGCRLTMLFFWMVLVCCAFYASRLNRGPDVPVDHLQHFKPSRQKRYTAGAMSTQAQCEMRSPSASDMDRLRRNSIPRAVESHKRYVHCSLSNTCVGNQENWRASCFSRDCPSFRVHVRGEHTATSSVDAEGLSDIVGKLFEQNGHMEENDIHRYVEVWCKDSELSEMKVITDTVSSQGCPLMFKQSKATDTPRRPTKHIHVLFFRFLSHWEIPVRLPALTSLFSRVSEKRGVEMKFDKQQATGWDDDDNLAMLVQGRYGRFSINDSLLRVLGDSGYCLRIQDLFCSGSRKQEQFVSNMTSYTRAMCTSRTLRHQDTVMDKLCMAGNLTDARARVVLTSLLNNVHGVEGTSDNTRSTMSVSLLNLKDFKNPDVLDLALKNIAFSLLQDESSVVILMSGVGNPTFIRFDQSTTLQTQASNPALYVVSRGRLSSATLHDARAMNQSLFSMRTLHGFMKKLIIDGGGATIGEKDLDESYNPRNLEENSASVCKSLGVKPPFMCLCQDEYVNYENDSLTVGFAELVVGLMNAQLREFSLREEKNSGDYAHSTCAKLYGQSFTNVRLSHHEDKKRISMDVMLFVEGFQDRLYRHAFLEMWDMDKLPRSEVHLYRRDHSATNQGGVTHMTLNPNESEILLKTLCNTETSLSPRSASDEAVLSELSQMKHFGRKPVVLHLHDDCLYMFVRDFGDSVSVEASNVCRDRRYDVMLHLTLMNMVALTPLPISASLAHAQTEFLTVLLKVSYTVPTFAYKLHPDFYVTYDK